MSAITIRNLPDDSHDALRSQAALWGRSVESLVREILVWVAREAAGKPTGMSDMTMPFLGAPAETPSFETLWGALRATVHVPPGTDLSHPAAEWEANQPG